MKTSLTLISLIFLSACASAPLTKTLGTEKTPRLGIIGFKVTAPIERLSSIQESPPKNISDEEEKRMVANSVHAIEDKAAEEFKQELEKRKAIEPVIIPEGSFGTKKGDKPTMLQLEQMRKEFGVDAVFYGEIPWYGKTRLIYPILFESLDISAESLALGLFTRWNGPIILANIGFELLTSTPLWFGGTYLFGRAFRPVSVEGHVISTTDYKEKWDDSVDRIMSQKELKEYPEAERSKKEVQLEASLKNAISGLAKSLHDEPQEHIATAGVQGGIVNLSGGGRPFTLGFSSDIIFDPDWRIGVQLSTINNSISVSGADYSQEFINVDAAIKHAWDKFEIGVLVGLSLYDTKSPAASSGTYFNCGLMASYDWMLMRDFSIGPQINLLWITQSGGMTEFSTLVGAKYWLF